MAQKSYGGEFLAGFLVGALAGAAAALLLAPQSGEETRTIIKEKGIELGHRAEDLTVEARRKAEDLSTEARRKAEELQVQAKDKAGELQVQAKDRAGSLQTKVKQAVEEGKSAAAKRREELLGQLEKGQGDQEIPL